MALGHVGKDWRTMFARNGVVVVGSLAEAGLDRPGTLLVTGCSSEKSAGGGLCTPAELYVGTAQQAFFRWCQEHGLRYGVLSDLHGLCWNDQLLARYDVHPSQVDEAGFRRLGMVIARKCQQRGYERIAYVYGSPMRARPYLRMLLESRVPFVYTTRLEG